METLLDINQILKILPHRYPFVLVDRVLHMQNGAKPPNRTGRKIEGIKNVTYNEHFFIGHFPHWPIMPGVLILEALAQVSALACYRAEDPEFDIVVAAMQNAKFRKPVVPGDTLRLTATITKDRGSMIVAEAKAYVGDVLTTEVEILASMTPKSEH